MLRIRRRLIEPVPDDPDGSDPIGDVFAELDDLRATVYRQNRTLRTLDARIARERAAAQVDEHRRVLIAVRALAAAIEHDPSATPEARSCAARFDAAVRRLEPEALADLG